MKKLLLKLYIIGALLAGFAGSSYAQTTYNWTGTAGNYNWSTPGNWASTVAAVTTNPAVTYPGQTGNTDIVIFGSNAAYLYPSTNALHPTLASADSVSVASVTIGDNSTVNGVLIPNYLEIAGKLNVTGTFLQKHSDNYGYVGDGSVEYPIGYNFHIQTYLWGIGKLYTTNMLIGDNTLPPTNNVANVTRFKMGNENNVAGLGLTIIVSNNFVINTQSRNDGTATNYILSVSNADVSLSAGSMTVGNAMVLQNTGQVTWDLSKPNLQPQARFTMDVVNNGESKSLILKGATPLITPTAYSPSGQRPSDGFGFFFLRPNTAPSRVTNLGNNTVYFARNGDQNIITAANLLSTSWIGASPCNWQNLVISGSGTKKFTTWTNGSPAWQADAVSIAGDLTITGTATLDLSSTVNPASSVNNPTVTFNNGSNFTLSMSGTDPYVDPVNPFTPYTYTMAHVSNVAVTAGATFNNGNSVLLIPGTTTNAGTFTHNGTGTLTFAGAVDNSGTMNVTNTGAVAFNNTFTNSATAAVFNQTAGTINFNNSYSNTGKFKATAGTVNLNQSGNQSLFDSSPAVVGNSVTAQVGGTTFFNVNVQNGGTKTMSGTGTGQFYVANLGTLTMSNTTTLAANGFLTLNSDVNGSATVANVPADCPITGNVTVQRYVAANRAYRLVSAPVYNGSDGTNKVYSINYLKNNTYLTGSGGGFDKTGNPTLYLYRENLAPLYTTFINSNFRGISDITAAPNYTLDTDGGPFNIPVGNGYLFYFRGSRKQASLAALTTAGAAATNDTLSAVGILNQQTIPVHIWYDNGNLSSTTLGYTTISGDPAVEGFNLVGNPYASSINFEALTSSGLAPFAYYLIPTGAQGAGNYGIYDTGLHTGSNGATKVIPSGLGFFVHATGPGATVTFTEAAKVGTQVTGPNLFMGKPIAETPVQYLRMQMALDSVNSDETIIAFNSTAKNVYDQTEDALYKVGTGKVSLSSISGDHKFLVINKLQLFKGETIPLKVGAAANGTYTLSMKAITGIPALYDVWLKDAFTKDSVNLRTTASYSFTIAIADTASLGTSRFTLVMGENPDLVCKLTSFTADKVDKKHQVELVWKAINEENYTHFTVERSNDDGKTFEVVGGLTSTGQGTYSILDNNPANGANLYRLRQEDYDNAISYSKPVLVQYSDNSNNLTGGHLHVYPNPAVDKITLAINPKSQNSKYSIRITNSVGMVVKQALTTDLTWENNVSNLLTGTYLIQVLDKNNNSLVGQTKFVKL